MDGCEIRLECLKLAEGDIALAKKLSDFAIHGIAGDTKPQISPAKGKRNAK